MAEKVVKSKTKLRDPMGEQRNEVTKFIAQNQSRQEFVPPLGKYVYLLKAEPLHITNNAWQSWVFNCTCHCNALHKSESPQSSNSSF